jgi:hypothetical protein
LHDGKHSNQDGEPDGYGFEQLNNHVKLTSMVEVVGGAVENTILDPLNK